MIAISDLLNPQRKHEIERYLEKIGTKITVKTSTGAGNSRKGLHDHMDTETEMFIVTNGSARMVVNGETVHLGKGEGKTDFLVTVGGSHGLFDKSEDFHCVIVLLDSNPH